MKRKFIIALLCIITSSNLFSQDLNGVTFGFGAGYSILQNTIYDYSLTPDTFQNLQQQPLARGSFVISSIITIKLGKLKVDDSNKLVNAKTNTNTTTRDILSRFSINASLDLVNIKSSDVSFNKSINGGLGLGFFITESIQAAVFYDYLMDGRI